MAFCRMDKDVKSTKSVLEEASFSPLTMLMKTGIAAVAKNNAVVSIRKPGPSRDRSDWRT